MEENGTLIPLLERHLELNDALYNSRKADALRDENYEADLRERLRQVENELFSALRSDFRMHVLPVLVSRFGYKVADQARDSDLRYSQVFNDFYVKVTVDREKHGKFWRARTERALRSWSATTIIHSMLDNTIRKRDCFAEHERQIAYLYEKRRAYFDAGFRTSFDEVLRKHLDEWERSGNLDDADMALVLKCMYGPGMTIAGISSHTGLSEYRVKKMKKRAGTILGRHDCN